MFIIDLPYEPKPVEILIRIWQFSAQNNLRYHHNAIEGVETRVPTLCITLDNIQQFVLECSVLCTW